jgi:sterol 3beta-glucosyltransferase
LERPIILLASGTRGDIYPYLALGLGLREAGYCVRMATHAPFRPLVERLELTFAPLEGNLSELMTRAGGQSALTYDGNPLRSLRATLRYYHQARALFNHLLETAWEACRGAGAIIAGLPTPWGVHIAEALGIPCVWAFLQPFSRTRHHPSVLLPYRFSLGPAYNALTHRLVEQLIWQPWRGLINRWRKEILGLSPAPLSGLFDSLNDPAVPVLLGYSPHLSPPPDDWPANHLVTGAWFLDDPDPYTPTSELESFLQAGPPPVYVGFGSPGSRSPQQVVAIVLQALQESGLRAVFALPPGVPEGLPLPSWAFPITGIPHVWLFPRLSFAVHHGGAGTTAASLRAGLPTLALPLAIDQFYWGDRVAALGLGPQPIPQRSLDRPRLVRALRQLTGDQEMRARARRFGQELAGEDGVARAVQFIQKVLS